MTMPWLISWLQGLGLGASLIIALGAQNAFVLRQGLKRQKLFITASLCALIIWFFSLAYGASWLAPLFRHPHAWKVLDGLVGCVMWLIAGSLI